MPSTPYTRGTDTVRITSTRLRPGNAVLTATDDHGLYPARTRTGSIVRTVASVGPWTGGRYRKGGRLTVLFDDGTHAPNLAAHQTWAVLADTVQA
ncbi:MAG TPA: hypothetical protein VF062_22350 [Candidatus Limnocylindrales bacterium]